LDADGDVMAAARPKIAADMMVIFILENLAF